MNSGGKREGDYCLTVRLNFAGKGVTFSVPPLLVGLMILLGLVTYQVANTRTFSEHERQAFKIAQLQAQNEQLQKTLAHKEKERTRMATLAEARSQELWTELESRDREISRLWRIVGDSPGKANRRSLHRHSMLGSRGGPERRNALAVKVEYKHLASCIEKAGEEMRSLSLAARRYHRRKVDAYQRELADRTPSIHPCVGDMTSGFGNRIHPVYGYGRFHSGCDFTTPYGTPIHATASGKVVHSDWLGGYGQVIEIDHGNGLKTLYAHCSELLVKKGDSISKGQTIAKVGTTGLSSGPHCHYEVRRGEKQIDPTPYLGDVTTIGKDASKQIANS